MAAPDFAAFNGDDALDLLGLAATHERVLAVLGALGHHQPLPDDGKLMNAGLELLALGFCLAFTEPPARVRQVRFELRRDWTGCEKFPGRLPWGLSSDLHADDVNTALLGRGRLVTPLGDNGWCHQEIDGYAAAFGFGSDGLLEVLLVTRA